MALSIERVLSEFARNTINLEELTSISNFMKRYYRRRWENKSGLSVKNYIQYQSFKNIKAMT